MTVAMKDTKVPLGISLSRDGGSDMKMNKVALIGLLVIVMLVLVGCDGEFNKVPRVDIIKNNWSFDTIHIPLREGYKIAEVPISILDKDDEYHIIIHCVKGE